MVVVTCVFIVPVRSQAAELSAATQEKIALLHTQISLLQEQVAVLQKRGAEVRFETALSKNVVEMMYGDNDATVKAVTFTDLDCPFCHVFHDTVLSITKTYAPDEVAWTYHHFPIVQLHPNSKYLAKTALCVQEKKGAAAAGRYITSLMDSRKLNEQTRIAQVPSLAAKVGVSKINLAQCVKDADTDTVLKTSITEAGHLGVMGTPHTILYSQGEIAVVEGAQPVEEVRRLIEELLAR